MKEDRQDHRHHHHHQRKFTLVAKKLLSAPTAHVVFLLLSYTLGYLSAMKQYYSSSYSSSSTHADETLPPNYTAPSESRQQSDELDQFRLTATRCADPVPPDLVRKTILDRVFNGSSPFDGFPPPSLRPLLRKSRVRGWGSNGAVFETLIRRVRPRTVIEVGTFLGASAVHMAGIAAALGLPATQILCVDDFRGWPGFRDKFRDIGMVNGDVLLLQQFMQNVAHANATASVLPVPFSSGSALEKLCEWGVYGDLIEVDAGHDFNSAWSDIARAYRLLRRPGGVLFGHDYFTKAHDRAVRRAVDLFARVSGLRVLLDGQHWIFDSP